MSRHGGQVLGDSRVDLEECYAWTTIQTPSGASSTKIPAQTSEEGPRRALLPAPIGACDDGHPPAVLWDDGLERVLVVYEGGAPV